MRVIPVCVFPLYYNCLIYPRVTPLCLPILILPSPCLLTPQFWFLVLFTFLIDYSFACCSVLRISDILAFEFWINSDFCIHPGLHLVPYLRVTVWFYLKAPLGVPVIMTPTFFIKISIIQWKEKKKSNCIRIKVNHFPICLGIKYSSLSVLFILNSLFLHQGCQ